MAETPNTMAALVNGRLTAAIFRLRISTKYIDGNESNTPTTAAKTVQLALHPPLPKHDEIIIIAIVIPKGIVNNAATVSGSKVTKPSNLRANIAFTSNRD